MRFTLIISFSITLGVLSCSRSKEKSASALVNPKYMEAEGYQVPRDSMNAPRVVVVDESKFKKTQVGKPRVIQASSNVHPAGRPKVIVAGAPRVCIPGQDSFATPRTFPVISAQSIAGIPDVVVAKDAYNKDKNSQNFSGYSKLQGMNHAFIRDLLEDKEGNLWIATHGGGVSRFNGVTFSRFTEKQGLPDNDVFCMLVDLDGSIWSGTSTGLSKYDGKTFTHFKWKTSDNIVSSMLQDHNGDLWIGTSGDGVLKYDTHQDKSGATFTNFNVEKGLPNSYIGDILQDDKGNFWFATDMGLYKHDGKSFFHFTDQEGLLGNIVRALLEDSNGNLWIGAFGQGVSKYDGASFFHFTEQEGLVNNWVLDISEDKHGNLWFATEEGLCTYDGNTFTHYTEEEGLLKNEVQRILEDSKGNLWFATLGGGVNLFQGRSFIHYTEEEGLPNNDVMSILHDDEENLWFATYGGGLVLYDGTSFTHFNDEQGLPYNYLWDALKDRDGNFWFGTYGDGVIKFEQSQNGPGVFTHISDKDGLLTGMVQAILEDRDGNLWFGDYGGVTKYSLSTDKKTVTLTHFTEWSNMSVTCMLEDMHGNIWIASYGNGLTKYDPRHSDKSAAFTHFTEKEGLSNNNIRSLLEDREGNLWIGTDGGGVTKYEPPKANQPGMFMHITEHEGLSNNAVLSILEDKEGNFWFGSRYGVSVLTPDKLSELSDNIKSGEVKDSDTFFKNFTYDNGFLGVGCTVNAILEDKSGAIWISANDRLTVHPPHAQDFTIDTIPPNIQITGIALFNELIRWGEIVQHQDTTVILGNGVRIRNFKFDNTSRWYGLPEHLSLAYNNNHVTFKYIGITLNQPKKVKYQYKLDGNDENWSAITSNTEAPYGNLPHGSYTFRVKAMNSDGYWSDEFHYPFMIRPPWWRTWWAYCTYGMLVLSLIYFTHRYQKQWTIQKEQEKASRRQAILNERLRISRDLHDEVGGTLSGIAMYSHIARDQLKTQPQEADKSLSVMQESAGDMVNKLSDIVWLLNPDQSHLKQLVEKLEEYARQMAQVKGIHVKTEVAPRIAEIELPIEVRKNIYLICKEAINNAVKYSEGALLELQVRDFDHTLEFAIRDNGIGFDPDVVKKGNGLENMQKRAEEIGADCNLDSTPLKGTQLIIRYKIDK